jgi:uncharacterized protein
MTQRRSPVPSLVLLVALLLPVRLTAQTLSIPASALADSTTRAATIARLASQAAAVYQDSNRITHFDHLFRLQLLAGRPAEASATLSLFRAAQTVEGDTTPLGRAVNAQYEIYLRAKELQTPPSASSMPSPSSSAYGWLGWMIAPQHWSPARSTRRHRGRPKRPGGPAGSSPRDTTVALADAVAWLRAVQIQETYRELGTLAAPLIKEDDSRRYLMNPSIQLKTPDGATVCATVWRPRRGSARLPALLQFTIYADTTIPLGDLRRNASNGYAAVIGFTRGKACSPDQPVPYVHNGANAVTVIEWIAWGEKGECLTADVPDPTLTGTPRPRAHPAKAGVAKPRVLASPRRLSPTPSEDSTTAELPVA